jgi:hypothetical protein
VLRSQLGRADPALAGKAARLAGVTAAQFWAGPQAPDPAAPAAAGTAGSGRASRRRRTGRDSVISLVLAVHAEADRPLGFDQVAGLAGNRVTRAQVSAASAALCRDGQLDRIRSGVYQWSAGQRAAARRPAPPRAQQPVLPLEPEDAPASSGRGLGAGELFSQLFPSGVQLTGELLADLEQWARLTSKLTTSGGPAR